MEILTFILGNEKFAINVELVDTIEYKMPITVVPKSKNYVIGLINIRGSVLPVIDTNIILKKCANISDDLDKLIIAKVKNERLALAVTEIDDVLEIADENVQIIYSEKDIPVINFDNNIISLLTYEDLCRI